MDIAKLFQQEIIASTGRNSWTGLLHGTEVTLYSKPICPQDHQYLRKKHYPDFLQNMPMGAMIELIALKAEDEGGNLVFKPALHVPTLMRMNQDLAADIFAELFGDQLEPETDDQFEERVGK